MLQSILNFLGFNEQKAPLKKQTLSKKEKEIYILTSLSTFASGIKSKNELYWTCGQKFKAYIDCETNILHKVEGRVTWKTKEPFEHPFDFQSKTIYKIKIEQQKQTEFISFPMIEVTESFARNEKLSALKNDFFVTDGLLNFELDYTDQTALGEINWLGEDDVYVYFNDVPNPKIAKQTLTLFKKMYKEKKFWNDKLKSFIAKETLNKVNEWITTYEERPKITELTLKNEPVIDEVEFYPNGDFSISFILKTYHYLIHVKGNINGELKKAYLEE